MGRKIICLCGSTRFKKEYDEINKRETLAGNIVVMPAWFHHAGDGDLTDKQKRELDELHFAKIDLADEVIIINPNGYIGFSTSNEIRYANEQRKPIEFMVPYERAPMLSEPDAKESP